MEYIVLPSRVKENIILQSAQDISYYVITVYTENLSARLLENREIQFYNSSDEVIFTMTSPYMYDSAGELSEEIAVEMVTKGSGCYFIKMTPDTQWLSDESRVYPVVIDPQVSVDTTRTNIIDNYVLEGAGVQNRNLDRLYIGNRSEGRTRAFIKYDTMPTIPEGANIVKATVYLRLTSGTSTAANASAYKVTGGDWSSDTITWANMPAATTSLALNISHNDASYYYFSCLNAVRGWYSGTGRTTGTNANYGFMVRYYDETVDDYNAFYSADCTNESQRPLLLITYFYASVPEGGTYTLTRPDVTGTVTWTSSDTSLATVNSSGVVSGIKAGSVTITASVSGSIVKKYTVFVRIPDGVYRIKSSNIGLYLGTYGGTSENTSVRMLAYSNTGETRFQQLWKVTYLDNGYYSIRPMYQLSMGLHSTSNNVDITTTYGPNDTLSEVVSNSRWSISSTSDRTAYSINNVGTSSLAMRYADGATSPGLGVITAVNSGTSASFHWKMEFVAPVNYSEDYRYKLLALNENGVARYDYFTNTSAIINNTLGDDIYTSFYREIPINDTIQLLSQSDIFIIHTHGRKEGFYLSTSSYITMSDVADCDLSGLKFALLLTCSTGQDFSKTHISSNAPVNIVEQMVCSGAETVVGFSEITYVSDCNRFAVDFATAAIEDGNTVYSAILNIDYTYYLKDMSEISRIGGNTALRLS